MRPSREETLMVTAHTWAQRSTCSRLQVGAVIAREGRILVQGYNGAPSGMPHCDHSCDCYASVTHPASPSHPEVSLMHAGDCASLTPCTVAEHAERNAIAFAARWGVALEGAELVCTHQPCLPCAMSIINAGIRKVTFAEPYRLIDGVELLEKADIEVQRYVDWSIRQEVR